MRALVALTLAFLIGCSTAPTNVERPKIYPDRTTPDACWSSFLWAWRQGDVKALQQCYGLWLREELVAQVTKQGEARVSAWYRSGAKDLAVDEAAWDKKSELTAYLTATLSKPGEQPVEVRFAFMKRDDGWCLDGKKTLR
jgi:hypothetical protein